MFAIDIMLSAWLAAACAVLLVPLLFLIAEWTFKPLVDWLEENEDAISSQVEPIVSSRS